MSEEGPKPLYWLPALLTLVAAAGIWIGTNMLGPDTNSHKEIQKLENELELQLSLFNEEIKPFEDEIAHQQHLNDCIAAKAKYGFQLAIYAMLYQIETGVEIHKARIELLVKTKEPKLRVFEFGLDDLKVKVDAILLHIKEVLEYWSNGVPASVLFGFNPESFRGSELKEFLDF